MSSLEHGWLLNRFAVDFESPRDPEDVMCYCEWCERPIYYNSDYEVVNGDRICCYCHEEHRHKEMEREMYEDESD